MSWDKIKNILGFEEELLESSPLKISDRRERHREKGRKAKVIEFSGRNERVQLDFAPNDIIVLEPKAYEDSLNVSTYLKRGNPVIVNIKRLDAETGKRFIDFICGSAYAYEGHMHRLSGTSFLFSPSDIGIVAVDPEDAPPHRPNKGNVEEIIYNEGFKGSASLTEETPAEEYEYFDEGIDEKEPLYA